MEFWQSLKKILLINTVLIIATYYIFQWVSNRHAVFHTGQCFKHKEFPFYVTINGLDSGNYVYTLQIAFLEIKREDEIGKFESKIKESFQEINCETGNPL